MVSHENSSILSQNEANVWNAVAEANKSEIVLSQAERDHENISKAEMAEVLKNPEHVGLNITGIVLPNPMVRRSLKPFSEIAHLTPTGEPTEETTPESMDAALEASMDTINARLEMNGKDPVDTSAAAEIVQSAIGIERSKDALFEKIMSEMPDGASVRIHPSGDCSPFSVESFKADGGLSSEAASIARRIFEKTQSVGKNGQSGHMIAVINNFGCNSERAGNIPNKPAEFAVYASTCLAFLDSLGLGEDGDYSGVTLELGNETNTSPDMGGEFSKATFVEKPDPVEYGKMFVEVAKMVKDKYPSVNLSFAGTAFLDPNYVQSVIETVISFHGADLVDEISYHPYKNTESSRTQTVNDGHYSSLDKIDNPIVNSLAQEGLFGKFENGSIVAPSELSVSEQELVIMQALASILDDAKSEGGKKTVVTVGEIGFYNRDNDGNPISVNTSELPNQSSFAEKNGITSYIWPGNDLNGGIGV